jgi:hypothetical protein
MGATSGPSLATSRRSGSERFKLAGLPRVEGSLPGVPQARKLSRHMLQRGGVVVPERQSSMRAVRVRKPQTSHPPGPTIPTFNTATRSPIGPWSRRAQRGLIFRAAERRWYLCVMATDDCRGAEGETASDHSGSGPSPHVGTMNCALCARHFPVHGVPCAGTRLRLPIHLIPRTTYGRVLWTGRRPCPECATPPGSPHHMPCDREYCPACVDGQRLTSCLDHFLWTALPSPAGRGTASRAAQPPPVWQPGQK